MGVLEKILCTGKGWRLQPSCDTQSIESPTFNGINNAYQSWKMEGPVEMLSIDENVATIVTVLRTN